MYENQEFDHFSLNEKVKQAFVKKDCDLSQVNTKAAIITAASKMATTSEIITSEQVEDALLHFYQLQDDDEVKGLIGMNPNFVQQIIGYSVDFTDYGAAMSAYNAQKTKYDELYNQIKEYSQIISHDKQL